MGTTRDAPGGAALDIRHVVKRFGAVTAVDDVSFTVTGGEFFALLGPSGCGKTTTLRLIGGFEQADAGDVLIDGQFMGTLPPNQRETYMVFQRLALFPHYNVFDNVAFGLRMKRAHEPEVRRRVRDVLDLVRLETLAGRRITELSGGQQQRVALARALVNRPRVLLLDEPLSSLDLKLRLQMQEELKRLQREVGTTFIYVTHDQGEAMAMSDRLGVMEGGRLYQVGSPLEIYEKPRSRFVAHFIGDANLLDGVVEGLDDGLITVRTGPIRVRARRQGWERAGLPVSVCVRPERVRIEAAGSSDGLRGRIEDIAFVGQSVKYRVSTGDLAMRAAVPYFGGMRLLRAGDEVALSWDPSQAVPVPADIPADTNVINGGMEDEELSVRRHVGAARSSSAW